MNATIHIMRDKIRDSVRIFCPAPVTNETAIVPWRWKQNATCGDCRRNIEAVAS